MSPMVFSNRVCTDSSAPQRQKPETWQRAIPLPDGLVRDCYNIVCLKRAAFCLVSKKSSLVRSYCIECCQILVYELRPLP